MSRKIIGVTVGTTSRPPQTHTHGNKGALDTITAEKIATWDEGSIVAKGKNRARVFSTTAAMQEWLSDEANKGVCNIGDNLYIIAIDVPDWWIAEVLDEADPDTGYFYKIAQLETQKVDLTEIEAALDNLDERADGLVSDVNGLDNELTGVEGRVAALEVPDIVETTDLVCPGSVPGGYRLLEMQGNTEQKQLSGKNLYNMISSVYSENGITVTPNGNGSFSASGTATANTSITLSDIVAPLTEAFKSGGDMILSMTGAKYNVDTCNISAQFITPDGTIRYMIPGNYTNVPQGSTTNGVVLYISSGTTISLTKVIIQLEKGTVATDYEPYCGGAPSPNPQFPQAMKSTGDCVEMVQGCYNGANIGSYINDPNRVCNKNPIPCKSGDVVSIETEKECTHIIYFYGDSGYLSYTYKAGTESQFTVPIGVTYFNFDIATSNVAITPDTVGKITLTINGKYVNQIVCRNKNFIIPIVRTTTSKGINFDVNKNGAVYINGTSVDYADCYIMDKVLPSGNYIFTQDNPNITSYVKCNGKYYGFNKEPLPFTADGINSVAVFIRVPSGTTINTEVSVMCREASVVDDTFEVGKEIITTFLTNEPLRAINDVKDEIIRRNGMLGVMRRIGKLVLNGDNKSWSHEASWSNPYAYMCVGGIASSWTPKYVEGYSTIANILSDYFSASNPSAVANTNGLSAIGQAYTNLYISVNGITTADDLNTWLSNNNPTVLYELAEPFFEVLDAESQRQLNSLETFEGATYIEVDSRVQPAGIRGEYATTKSAGYTLKALNNSESYLASVLVPEPAVVSEEE